MTHQEIISESKKLALVDPQTFFEYFLIEGYSERVDRMRRKIAKKICIS